MKLTGAPWAFVILALVACQPRAVTTAPTPAAGDSARRMIAATGNAAPTNASLQLIVVITDDWDAVPGVMRRYERDGVRAPWRAVGGDVPVVVGAAGLGWGD